MIRGVNIVGQPVCAAWSSFTWMGASQCKYYGLEKQNDVADLTSQITKQPYNHVHLKNVFLYFRLEIAS